MKAENAPEVDETKAVAELKARKRTLEAKVRTDCLFMQIQHPSKWNSTSFSGGSVIKMLVIQSCLVV